MADKRTDGRTDGRTEHDTCHLPRKKQRFKGDVGVVSVVMHDADVAKDLRAPFPWFGGKRRVADIVWDRFGNVDTYNEPFFGAGSVLLGRPNAPRVETVNDLDCYLANFWRALQAAPDEVAFWADAPVNEADLHARHRWLVTRGRRLVARCMRDAHYFSAKVAGWWVWGQCLWIGSGWCQVGSSGLRQNEQVPKRPNLAHADGKGILRSDVHRQFDRNAQGTVHQKRRPHLTSDQGLTSHQNRRPHLLRDKGVAARRWQGGGQGGGSGVHAPRLAQQKPDLAGDAGAVGRGIHASAMELRTGGLYQYLEQLARRMRRVRVCCGDWTRVLTPSVTTYIGLTGVFLDPPYSHDLRERCYSEDHDISADVRAWALANGDDANMRIALCGYEDEHGPHMPDTWEKVAWKAHGGYSRTDRGVANREQERIWFSPNCLKPDQMLPLFSEAVS